MTTGQLYVLLYAMFWVALGLCVYAWRLVVRARRLVDRSGSYPSVRRKGGWGV